MQLRLNQGANNSDSHNLLPETHKIAQELLNIAQVNNALLQGIGSGDDLSLVSTQSSVGSSVIQTEIPDAYISVMDKQITRIANQKIVDPNKTFDELAAILEDLGSDATPNNKYRIKANMALCLLSIDEDQKGGELMLEACAEDPTAKYANANLVVGTLALHGAEPAVALGADLLKENPDDAHLWNYYLQALRTIATDLSCFDRIPILLRENEQVYIGKVLLARALEDVFWTDIAVQGAKTHPESLVLKQALADAMLTQVLESDAFKNKRVVTPDSCEKLDVAIELYNFLWADTEAKPYERQQAGVNDLANLILAYELRNRGEKAIGLCKENINLLNEHPYFAERACLVGTRNNDTDLVRKALPHVESQCAAAMFSFQLATATKDFEALATLDDEALEKIDEPDRHMARVLRELSAAAKMKSDAAAAHIQLVFDEPTNGLREKALCIDFAEDFAGAALASSLYAETVKELTDDDNFVDRHMLYYRALRRNDSDTVLKCLDGFVSLDIKSKELSDLAWAHVERPIITQATVDFFKSLGTDVRNDAYLQQIEGAMQFKRGDLEEAKRLFASSFAIKKQAETLLSLIQTLKQLNDDRGVRQLLKSVVFDDLLGDLAARIFICRLSAKYKRGEEALNYAYKALLGSKLNADAVVQYVIMIMHEGRHCNIKHPKTIVVDTEVQYLDKHGINHTVFITDYDTADEGNYFNSDHLLSLALMGHCQDELVTLDWTGDQDGIRITSIKNGPVALSHNFMNVLSKRFPEQQALTVITTKDDDIEPFLERVRGLEKAQNQVADQYLEKSMPLFIAAHFVGMNSIGFAQYLHSRGYDVKTNIGTTDAFDTELSLLLNPQEIDLCLDTFTLWKLHHLNLLKPISELFNSVSASRNSLNALLSLANRFDLDEEGESLSIEEVDGQIYRNVLTVSQRKNHVKEIRAACDSIMEIVDFIPVTAPKVQSQLVELLANLTGTEGLEPIFLCNDGRLLLSEDLHFRQLARQSQGVQAVGILPVLISLLVQGKISRKKRQTCIAQLAAMGHTFLTVNIHDLYISLLDLEDENGEEFKYMSKELLGKYGGSKEHINLTLDVFNSAFIAKSKTGVNVQRGLGNILAKVYNVHGEQAKNLISALYNGLSEPLQNYIVDWHRGHFISF